MPRERFQAGIGGNSAYSVSPDSKRFLLPLLYEADTAAPLTVVLNWPAVLKR